MKFVLALIVLLSSGSAFAQSSFSPIKKAPGELVQLRTYNRSPIRLNDYSIIETREVLNGNRLDFQQTYDVQFWELVEALEVAYKKKKAVSVVDAELLPNAKQGQLYIIGMGSTGGKTRITLGDVKNLPYKFTFDITSDDQSRAVVTVHSAMRSTPYGGARPARAGFKPVGAKMVKFLWD